MISASPTGPATLSSTTLLSRTRRPGRGKSPDRAEEPDERGGGADGGEESQTRFDADLGTDDLAAQGAGDRFAEVDAGADAAFRMALVRLRCLNARLRQPRKHAGLVFLLDFVEGDSDAGPLPRMK